MATALSIGATPDAAPPVHRFTVHDFHGMGRAELFGEDDRIELIDGELRDMAPIGNAHVFTVNRLNALFAPLSIDRSAVVHVQNPLQLASDTEVYPDVVLLAPPSGRYRGRAPGADDTIAALALPAARIPVASIW